ncbi:MAG: tRNA uridine-5-carboxymethylaminomethyl(34) synthesis GTPase MnmE [Acidobacteria bacterium RBG_16_68_9]|nr:MAG: tRNA uridine-5-carboxymethylaminomethyl(34) synthesis GTPase MnmE [Acidobacteria bacterium RBG_16_68_9]
MYAEDTIAAIATPLGPGGIGVIRVSGPAAEPIARRVFLRRSNAYWQSHRLYRGRIVNHEGALIDEGLAVLMRKPRSHTGEDVLEIHCHGSPAVLRLALEGVLRLGARPAEPGEFTKRAFLNGKLDLTQVEAVTDLVRARTPESAAQAADQLLGHLSQFLGALRARLVGVKARLEAQIDFSDEDIGSDDTVVWADLGDVRRDIETILGTYARGRLLRHGLRIAILGRPNAGKSSLLNALLSDERAIVTPIPGTTRDVIEESADFDGVPVVLSDTAGLRSVPDEVERFGIERAWHAARSADVVLFVADASLPPQPIPPFEAERVVVALNKIDLPCAWPDREVQSLAARGPVARVSAKYLTGLDELRRLLVDTTAQPPRDSVPALTTTRQRDALAKALESVKRAADAATLRVAPELIAVDVQAALDHIGAVTGAVTSEDVLDAIFAEFCIGK